MKKKVYLIIINLLCIFLLAGCGSTELSDSFVEDDVIAKAKSVVALANEYSFDNIISELREDLQSELTAEEIEASWKPILDKVGSFSEYKDVTTIGSKSKSTQEEFAITVLSCTYEKGTITYTLSFDTNLDLVGLYAK